MRTSVATIPSPVDPPPPAVPARPRRAPERLVIVGNGMVGHRLCRRLVELDTSDRYEIVVFGEEPQPAYDRVHLTDAFSARSEDDLLLAPAAWYAEHGIELRLAEPVVEIDRQSRVVRSASGSRIGYSRLVLATGSSPHVPAIEGAGLSRVFVYRTIGDLQAMRRHARRAQTAAVIGGGLLGLEAARALQRHGLAVVIIEAAASLMPAQLDQHAGTELERQIAGLGIDVRTGTITRRIEASGECRTLHFVGGGSVAADIVVIAAGVRPRTQLAERCDLARCPGRGIVVDDYLRTSDPHIFAVGECASHRAHIYGLVAPGYEMADALALGLTGRPTIFAGASPTTRLKLLGVEVTAAGEPLDRGSAVPFHGQGAYRLIRIERGRLSGALGVGAWPEFSRLQEAIAQRRRVWPWQAARFQRAGTLWDPSPSAGVADWPSTAVVCNCLNVTRGQIAEACARGACTLGSVVESTGASTLCGSCSPLVAQLVGALPAPAPRLLRGLLAASLAALTVTLVVLLSPPVPFATAVQDVARIEVLWRDSTYRQISGFTVLAMSVLAASMTLRKRSRLASSLGTYATWRTMHALIGLLTLVALAVHTGARLGDNLNFALMVSFGALNILGAAAGGLTAAEQKLGARAGRLWRAALVTAHVLAIWPLPMLIAFHIVSVYYF